MAELHDLSPVPGSHRDRKRVGRGPGSGTGKTAGRGQKGQKSRSGGSIPAGFEGGQMPLHRRIPKRGFFNRNRVAYQVVNVGDLGGLSGDVTPETLRAAGLVGSARKPVKILGNGEIETSLRITAHAFSASARQKIEAAGGTATVPAHSEDEQA
ncbi:MAG: 50S ribosomal protein L15 [Gemmatimonadota bacterium]|jgi:large subunit ribosomal protein L15